MVSLSTHVRIAHLKVRSHVRPRVAIERDDALYDVEALERELGAAFDVPGDAWDFHLRVVALGCAGLFELDAMLGAGRRPASARLLPEDIAPLAPCDATRAAFVHADVRELATRGRLAVRVGAARELLGQDALVGMPRGETRPDFEIGVAALIGEELDGATRKEARNAIVGYAVLDDWSARDAERDATPILASAKSLRAQIGPCLVAARALPQLDRLAAWIEVEGRRLELGTLADLGIPIDEAVARVSSELPLVPGDVVGVGPLPRGSGAALGLELGMHRPVAVAIERLGTLRGTAVPRR